MHTTKKDLYYFPVSSRIILLEALVNIISYRLYCRKYNSGVTRLWQWLRQIQLQTVYFHEIKVFILAVEEFSGFVSIQA